MFKDFENYIAGMLTKYDSFEKLILVLSDKLIQLKNNPNKSEISKVSNNYLTSGRFSLIQYNFNGNLIWCPILTLDYKVHKNKHLLYAVNLEYLPPRYKVLLFSKIFNRASSKLETIADNKLVSSEPPLQFMNFDFMYKLLKKNNMDSAITAYDIGKIKNTYLISIKISPQIILADMKKINSKNMKELHISLSGEAQKKLGDIIGEYDTIIEEYQLDSIKYHKKVALFREKLKIFRD